MRVLQQARVRSFIRRSGIKTLAYQIYSAINGSSTYEAKFSDALLGSVQLGDCVWDIGANVGFYASQLATRVGPTGRVIAFEPFSASFNQLRSKSIGFPQIQCVRLALGATEKDLTVNVNAPTSPTNNLWQKSDLGDQESIRIKTGTGLISEGFESPTIIKIDVEGFEEEVLLGFRDSLRDTNCRAIFVEIHYALLEQRGFLRAPSRIVSLLQDLGFKARWVDPSHVVGVRVSTLPSRKG